MSKGWPTRTYVCEKFFNDKLNASQQRFDLRNASRCSCGEVFECLRHFFENERNVECDVVAKGKQSTTNQS